MRAALKCGSHVSDAGMVAVGADVVLGDDYWNFGDCACLPDRGFECLGVELVAHQRGFGSGWRFENAVGADAVTRVGLDADEIVAARRLEENVLAFGFDPIAPLFAARLGLQVAKREANSDWKFSARRFDRGGCEAMRLEHLVARLHLLAHQVGRDAIRIAAYSAAPLLHPSRATQIQFLR